MRKKGNVEYTKLHNVSVVYQQTKDSPVFSTAVYLNCGSRDEEEKTRGLTHFFEHMVFKGTESRTAAQISEEIESVGGELDAFTTRDLLCFNFKVPSSFAEKGIDVLFDMLLNPVFKDKDISLEKNVVKEEIRMSKENHEDSGDELFISLIYPESELGRSILGDEQTVESFERKHLFDFREKAVSFENMVVSAAGPEPFGEFLDKVEKYLKQVTDSRFERSLKKQQFNIFNEKAKRKGMDGVNVYCAFETFPPDKEERLALSVLNNVLGNGMSSRLFVKIREESGLAYSVVSFPVYHRNEGMLYLYASTSAGREEEVKDKMLEECFNLHKTLTEKEFEKGKSQLLGNLSMGFETSLSKALFNGKNILVYGKPRNFEEIIKEVEKITFEQTKNLAKRIFTENNFSVLLFGNV